MYLGVKFVLSKSFARIHRANLINFGILPLTFSNAADYNSLDQGDKLEIRDVLTTIRESGPLEIKNVTKGTDFQASYDLTDRQKEIIMAGGLLNYTKRNAAS